MGVSNTLTHTEAHTNVYVNGGVASMTTPVPAIACSRSVPVSYHRSSPVPNPHFTNHTSGVLCYGCKYSLVLKNMLLKRKAIAALPPGRAETAGFQKEELKQPISAAWYRVEQKQQNQLLD